MAIPMTEDPVPPSPPLRLPLSLVLGSDRATPRTRGVDSLCWSGSQRAVYLQSPWVRAGVRSSSPAPFRCSG